MSVRPIPCFVLAALLLMQAACGSPVKLALALKEGSTEFRSGEQIVLELSFTTDEENVTINTTTTESPNPVDTIELSPLSGVFPWLNQKSGDKRYSPDYAALTKLTPNQPFVIRLALNDLYRFDSAGHYTVRVTSNRIWSGNAPASPEETLVSNEVSFDVVAYPEADQRERAAFLEQRIRAATDMQSAQRLATELDYLPGDAAIPAKLSLYLNPKSFYPFGVDVSRGLWIARNRSMVVALLEKALSDPKQSEGAGTGLLEALVALRSSLDPGEDHSSTTNARLMAEYVHLIARSIPSRQGKALIDAARTVFVTLANSGDTNSPDFQMAREVILTRFEEVNEYNVDWMLNTYGKYLRDPRITPALHHILDTMNDPMLSGDRAAAIVQLAAVTPEDVPRYIVQEACADNPIMLHTVSPLIATDTLPETDGCLKQKLMLESSKSAPGGRRQLGATMEYIARFADSALVPDVRRAYMARDAEWDQASRGAAVTYLMRWDGERSRVLLVELMPGHDSSGEGMLFFLLDAAHAPAAGMRKAFRECVLTEAPRAAGECAYALSQIGEPEDRPTIEARVTELRKEDGSLATPEAGVLEGELVAAILKGATWDTPEPEATDWRASCISDACKRRFNAGP